MVTPRITHAVKREHISGASMRMCTLSSAALGRRVSRRRRAARRASSRPNAAASSLRHAEVRHRVDAVRGDLEVEHRVVAMLLDRLDRVADLGKPLLEFVVAEIGEIDVVD